MSLLKELMEVKVKIMVDNLSSIEETIYAVVENTQTLIKKNFNSKLTNKKNEITYNVKIGLIQREHD